MEDTTPIIIGGGQFTQKTNDPLTALPPMGIAGEAAKAALADTGQADAIAKAIDTIAIVRIFPDSSPRRGHDFGRADNPPRAVARRIGANPHNAIYSVVGGQTPQALVSEMAEKITAGDVEVVLLGGAESIKTQRNAVRQGIVLDWNEHDEGSQEDRTPGAFFASAQELQHGIGIPINTYPLLEQAMRGHLGNSIAEHMPVMGNLFAPFTKIAARNPYSYYPTERTAEELVTATDENRWIGFPYPKWLVAQDNIDQGASVIMTSVGKAKALGIDPSKWVFIHGVSEAKEGKTVLDRAHFHASHAMRVNAGKAFDMAGIGIDDISFIDIYSCFTSAVEQACDAVGLAWDDPRGLTLTGGLPYFGGPGNNYSMHGFVEMLPRLRANPGSYALITANGGTISKHATGIYSTTPTQGTWQRESPAVCQAEVDKIERPAISEAPSGDATIETYTVIHSRNGPANGIVIGRLNDTGARFCANTPDDPGTLQNLMEQDSLGRGGAVNTEDGKNTFTPA
jgi:acetyl-CoA C-acetyltransferase